MSARAAAAAGLLALFCVTSVAARDTIGLCLADEMQTRLHLEMRRLLGAVHGVHEALVEGDAELLAERAAAVGSAMDGQVEQHAAHQHAGLPHGFIKLGRATHAAFDDLATRAREGGDASTLLPALSAVTGRCVQCHEKYRIAPASECATEDTGGE